MLSLRHVRDKNIKKWYCKIEEEVTRNEVLLYGSYGQKLMLAYFWVADSNKILAVAVAISSFMLFRNLGIRYNKVINAVASATFGVLLIHANSDTMRQWLWKDTLDNVGFYISESLPAVIMHALASVILIYSICTAIEYARIRFTERKMLDGAEKIISRIQGRVKL